jgi:hypothetical protein
MVELVMSIDRMIESARGATPIEGEWPPATILGHVSEVDRAVWIPRLQLMVVAHRSSDQAPAFVWSEPDAMATAAMFESVSLDQAAATALHARTELLMTLRDLSDDDWTATATHDAFGDMSVADLMMQVLAHDEEHRAPLVLSRFDN